MKFGFGKRIAGFVLAAAVAAGTFLSTPVTAKAAAPLAKGIDVSKYQGAVNWSAVKNAGYSFAFIKAGSAKSGLDPYYAVNMAGATAAGMKVGVYVYSYATTVEGAMTEAQFAIAAMEPYSVSYPVVYDLEDSIHKNMSPDQLAALTVAFCSTVQQAGYYPMVYSSKNWMVGKIAATPYDKWIAQYNTVCEYPNPAFWQYSNSGVVAGINGSVDVNYQFKDYSNLIVANGFVDRAGGRYYYKNYRMQYGFIEDGGKRYFMNTDGTLYKKGWLGDGINMTIAAGAEEFNGVCYLKYNRISHQVEKFGAYWGAFAFGGPMLWVNQDCERFVDEGYVFRVGNAITQSAAVHGQNGVAYSIFDQAIYEKQLADNADAAAEWKVDLAEQMEAIIAALS